MVLSTSHADKEGLDSLVANFNWSDPETLNNRFSFALTGDSEYGAKIGIVKDMLADALHDNGGFAEYLSGKATELRQEADQLTGKYSNWVFRGLRRLGLHGGKDEEISELYTLSNAYDSISQTVAMLGEQFGSLDPSEIVRLVEYDNILSGENRGITKAQPAPDESFKDPRILGYAEQLYMQLSLILNPGNPQEMGRLTTTPVSVAEQRGYFDMSPEPV